MITIQDGNYHYTEETGVHDIQLQIQKGETVGLMGPNGAGKSTLLNAISGVWPVDEGHIIIDGKDVTKLPEYRRAAWLGSCPSRLVSTTSRIGPLTKTS